VDEMFIGYMLYTVPAGKVRSAARSSVDPIGLPPAL
jgi:hypothetical protein